jgi:light-regulated signal transduction histidine kinase (bacteriophytochrome)
MSTLANAPPPVAASGGAGLPFPYSVKRHGVSLTNCDDEPVRTPGCIQGHGLMLALNPADLVVTQISENWPDWNGRPVESMLGQTLAQVLGQAEAERVAALLASELLEANPLYALTTRLGAGPKADVPLDLSIHLADGVLIVELEPTGRDNAPPISAGDYYSMVKQTLVRLKAAASLAGFCEVAAAEVRRITRLDRVMVYHFHADDTGQVLGDSHRADLHSWLGLRYPAKDIPKPAREIFKRIGVRPLPDVDAQLCEMVPLLNPTTGRPLDMTHCALRGASKMYTEYLRNMGVAATLAMPVLRAGELWGLIVCHHYTPIEMPFPVRAAAEFMAQMVSLEIAAAEGREHVQYQLDLDTAHYAALAHAATEARLGALAEGPASLLEGIRAGGVAVSEHGRWSMAGNTPEPAELDALIRWLTQSTEMPGDGRPVVALDALSSHFAEAAGWAPVAAGLLAIPISQSLHGDWVLWFRPEQLQTFKWGGNPYDKPMTDSLHGARLTPRKSFEIWQEEARGRSAPWLPVELDAALKLRVLVRDVVIGRAEQLAVLNTDLVRSNDELDAFAYVAGHDLKEPLRGIHKHAHQLLQDAQASQASDDPSRVRLDAMLRLTVRMDGLLDALLHFSRVGRLLLERDEVPLDEVLADALDSLGARLEESGVAMRVPRPLPAAHCDRVRMREIFANLVANAAKYNDKPERWAEVGYLDPGEAPRPADRWGAAARLAGQRVFYVRDNGIGIEDRHRDRVFMMFKRLHARDAFGGGSGAGLAIVKKLVEQHRGAIWFESTPGVGTTFYFTLGNAEVQAADD